MAKKQADAALPDAQLTLAQVVEILEGPTPRKDGKVNPRYDWAVKFLPAMQAALREIEQLKAAAPVAVEPDAAIAPFTLEHGMFNAMVARSVAQEAALAEDIEAENRLKEQQRIAELEARLAKKEAENDMVKAQRDSLLTKETRKNFRLAGKASEAPTEVPAPVAQKVEAPAPAPAFERPEGYGERNWSCRITINGITYTYMLRKNYDWQTRPTWSRRSWENGRKDKACGKEYTADNPPPEVLEYLKNGGVGKATG